MLVFFFLKKTRGYGKTQPISKEKLFIWGKRDTGAGRREMEGRSICGQCSGKETESVGKNVEEETKVLGCCFRGVFWSLLQST